MIIELFRHPNWALKFKAMSALVGCLVFNAFWCFNKTIFSNFNLYYQYFSSNLFPQHMNPKVFSVLIAQRYITLHIKICVSCRKVQWAVLATLQVKSPSVKSIQQECWENLIIFCFGYWAPILDCDSFQRYFAFTLCP